MPKTFYISDLHFGHGNIIRYDNRPFKDTDEMERIITENWNKAVSKEDTVYILGDVNWATPEEHDRIMSGLNGNKILITGNHDTFTGNRKNCTYNPYDKVYDSYAEIKDDKTMVVLSHYPIMSYKNMFHGYIHLFGHVHVTTDNNMVESYKQTWEDYYCKPCRMYNVGCMMPWMNYTPRTLEEIVNGYNECCHK